MSNAEPNSEDLCLKKVKITILQRNLSSSTLSSRPTLY